MYQAFEWFISRCAMRDQWRWPSVCMCVCVPLILIRRTVQALLVNRKCCSCSYRFCMLPMTALLCSLPPLHLRGLRSLGGRAVLVPRPVLRGHGRVPHGQRQDQRLLGDGQRLFARTAHVLLGVVEALHRLDPKAETESAKITERERILIVVWGRGGVGGFISFSPEVASRGSLR